MKSPYLAILACFFLMTLISCASTMTQEKYTKTIQDYLDKSVNRHSTIPAAQVLLIAPEKDLEIGWTAGDGVGLDDPFHIASVGKSFTAVIIAKQVEKGKLSWNTPIAPLLPPGTLTGLYVIDGVDYSDRVTIGQLLNHTSGCADYFDDPVNEGLPMQDLIHSQPDRIWTPTELLAFSADRQNPVAIPGELYHYSDTGYILLGLIAEKLYERPFYQVLEDQIFTPLRMDHTSLLFYPSTKSQTFGPTYLGGKNINGLNSLSVDWAGGGIVSTTSDLALFAKALINYELLQEETLQQMFHFDQKFMRGIHYGYGFMEYHFGEYFFTLKSLPKMKGHMGILGTQLMMDFESGTILITNFSSTDGADESIKTAIRVLAGLSQY